MKRPFWMHQLVEYVLAIGLVSVGAHSSRPAFPALSGAVIAINAAIVEGPWSAFHAVPRTVHRILDWVIVALMLLFAIFVPGLFDGTTRGLTFMMAGVIAFVALNSDYSKKRKKPPVSTEGGRHVEVGRMAGRSAANAVNLARAVKRSRENSKNNDK